MRHMVNGRIVELQTDGNGCVDSDLLRQAAGVPGDRPLILQLPDGSNRIINPGEKVRVSPEQFFVDAPAHRRGDFTAGLWSTRRLGMPSSVSRFNPSV